MPGCATRPRHAGAPALIPAPALDAPRPPAGRDTLPRWRENFPALQAALTSAGDINLFEFESADAALAPLDSSDLAPAFALLPRFDLAPGDVLVFDPVVGPETPFPDHQPLRQIAALRTIHTRGLLNASQPRAALALTRRNLAHARASLSAQTGILPLIHATGVWQSALDSAHAIARHPDLSPADTRALLDDLLTDSGLPSRALKRAFTGEYTGVFQVVVDRMPDTDDPDLLLSAVSTLGMDTPSPLAAGELGLGLTDHRLLDRTATYDAYRRDLAPYFAALDRSASLPRGLYASTTATTLAAYREELGAFYHYATGEGPVTWDLVVHARSDLEATANPVGKLLSDFLTPSWESLIVSTLRREAQRQAVIGLLAWRLHGRPAPWADIIAAGLLASPPADPFADGAPLLLSTGQDARVWSVFFNATDDGGHLVDGNSGQPDDLVWLK
jgi:hypothetical protein